MAAITAPHEGDTEVIFPVSLRAEPGSFSNELDNPGNVNWRFRVPIGRAVCFDDHLCGPQQFFAGTDFGDFVVWSSSLQMPSYELAVVVDDADMGITEVVRGCDLLLSTARQILLYEALELSVPSFFHCPLMRDSEGRRMAKRERDGSTTLKGLRDSGWTPDKIIQDTFVFHCDK